MSWVEELKPDDDVKVEIIYPANYVKYSMDTIKKYSAAVAYLCKAAAILEEDETEFMIMGMTILQVVTLEEAMKHFGIEMTHDHGKVSDGTSWTYFYADVRKLQERLRGGGF